MWHRATAVTLALAGGLSLAAANGPAIVDVSTKQVSVTHRGGSPDRQSGEPALSADGRYVAFSSPAGELVPDDHSIWEDVFVRDVVSRTTLRVSVDTEGGDANGRSFAPSISADGRFVAFASLASDLVPADGNGSLDVFIRDLVAGTTVRASLDAHGGDADGESARPKISADGGYVVFNSDAPDLVSGDTNHLDDIFVRDLVAGTTIRASVNQRGGDPNAFSYQNAISADGRFVAFVSYASNLVPDDDNGFHDVFVRDLVAGTTVRASVDSDGGDPNNGSDGPVISADGRYVGFWTYSSDLVPGDTNGLLDVYVRDLVAGANTRVSVDMNGEDANSTSNTPWISAEGRYVAFTSSASDLVLRDRYHADAFVRDMVAGVTFQVSLDLNGKAPNGHTGAGPISADGHVVALVSSATDLVQGPGDEHYDVFVTRWW